jgi:hypothetical protein
MSMLCLTWGIFSATQRKRALMIWLFEYTARWSSKTAKWPLVCETGSVLAAG